MINLFSGLFSRRRKNRKKYVLAQSKGLCFRHNQPLLKNRKSICAYCRELYVKEKKEKAGDYYG